MQKTILAALAALTSLLASLSPAAKAIVPAGLAVADVLVNLAVTGSLNATDLAGAAGALVAAVIAFLVPNKTRPAKPLATANWGTSGSTSQVTSQVTISKSTLPQPDGSK